MVNESSTKISDSNNVVEYINRPYNSNKKFQIVITSILAIVSVYSFLHALLISYLKERSLPLVRFELATSLVFFGLGVFYYFLERSDAPLMKLLIKKDSIVLIYERGKEEEYRFDDIQMYAYLIEDITVFNKVIDKLFLLRVRTKDGKTVELSALEWRLKLLLIRVFEEHGIPFNEEAIKFT